jgi:hypothetical protein
MGSVRNRPAIEESPKWQFKRNLVRLLKLKNMTHADLAEMTDMSTSKVQRLADCSIKAADAGIDLNDADAIALALGTTVGYLCGTTKTKDMLQQTVMMQQFAEQYLQRLKELKKTLAQDEIVVGGIETYLSFILDNIDELNMQNAIKPIPPTLT